MFFTIVIVIVIMVLIVMAMVFFFPVSWRDSFLLYNNGFVPVRMMFMHNTACQSC